MNNNMVKRVCVCVFLMTCLLWVTKAQQAPKREFRGAWIQCVNGQFQGMSAQEMGELLYKKGLIRDEKLFRIQYFLSEYKKDLLPGTFTLRTNMTVEEMLKVMTVDPEQE